MKTGLGIFSDNQYETLSKIRLQIAVFHVNDVLAKPQYIEMDWTITSGEKFARSMVDVNENDDGEYGEYRGSRRHNAGHNNYGSSYGNNYNSQRSGIVAKFDSTCVTCNRRIIAGKGRLKRDDDGDWVHARCV